jgi:hypothetical protein
MAHKFASGGHHWKRISSDDPRSAGDWARYVQKYLKPYHLTADEHPALYFCKTCRICVPATGPSTDDANCVEVSTRYVMET